MATGSRSVTTHGAVQGSAIVTGDHNQVSVTAHLQDFATPATVDPVAELARLRKTLLALGMDSRQQCKIENALNEATADASDPQPNREEVASGLERAVSIASRSADFTEALARIQTSIAPLLTWLGPVAAPLAALVGISL